MVDLSRAWKSAANIINEAISLLPNLLLAALILVAFLIVGSLCRSYVRRFSRRRGRHETLGLLLGQAVYIAVVIFGFLIALSVVAPSFHAGDLIKVLGIGSVAIGFAFQNILQNFLAGILLLLHEPFRLGDTINVTGLEGEVQDIQARATVITTSDQRRIIIPNAVLFTNPVEVMAPSGAREAPGPRAVAG